jgi:hypothetical protein
MFTTRQGPLDARLMGIAIQIWPSIGSQEKVFSRITLYESRSTALTMIFIYKYNGDSFSLLSLNYVLPTHLTTE